MSRINNIFVIYQIKGLGERTIDCETLKEGVENFLEIFKKWEYRHGKPADGVLALYFAIKDIGDTFHFNVSSGIFYKSFHFTGYYSINPVSGFHAWKNFGWVVNTKKEVLEEFKRYFRELKTILKSRYIIDYSLNLTNKPRIKPFDLKQALDLIRKDKDHFKALTIHIGDRQTAQGFWIELAKKEYIYLIVVKTEKGKELKGIVKYELDEALEVIKRIVKKHEKR